MELKRKIIEAGLKIGYLEKKAGLPRTSLYQFLDGKKALTESNLDSLKKVLKKYKIN